MFDAPEIIKRIPDIKQLYDINAEQEAELATDVQEIDNDIFFDTMSEEAVKHWEDWFDITPAADDNLATRRFRVKAKATERLPYSVRVFRRRLNGLFPEGYTLIFSDDLTEFSIRIPLAYAKALPDAVEFIEAVAPLNMVYSIHADASHEVDGDFFTGGTVVGDRRGILDTEPVYMLPGAVYAGIALTAERKEELWTE